MAVTSTSTREIKGIPLQSNPLIQDSFTGTRFVRTTTLIGTSAAKNSPVFFETKHARGARQHGDEPKNRRVMMLCRRVRDGRRDESSHFLPI